MSFSWTRVGAIIHKELRDYRHNRFVIGTMAATAMLFIIAPTIQLFVALSTGNTAHLNTRIGLSPFLIAKAVAAFVPTLVIAYIVFGIFLAAAALFAHPVIASAIYAGTHVLVQLLFTPLRAGWAIWGGIAVSARSADVRAAQQLSMLVQLAAADHRRLDGAESDRCRPFRARLAAALLAFYLLVWRVVAAMFDRERLVTGRHG
jgi:hypothetical protein